ncbi:MAG: NAD(P)/FAD-dependent oxidoreductase [Synechococcaceae cyanobacterium]|nr:NAD(P)/FAD-dependent oxidoreductase [Synechococcaceae cyanobacterium]
MLPSHAAVVVAGGGPAGFMAAITAAEAGLGEVLVLEATQEPLHKVRISGGGRCNVTHACWDPADLVGHYPRGGRALRGPFAQFAPGDAVGWFDAHGLELVQEDDGRLFPRSNRSSSVVATLRRAAAAAGVGLETGRALREVEALTEGGGFRLELRDGTRLRCDRLVLATGSHPSGHRIARALGHGLVPPVPSLFTLRLAERSLGGLAGVTMDPVALELPLGKRCLRERGPVLITHWGLSGPATLRLTAFAARALRERGYHGELVVDWTGGRDPAEVSALLDEARRGLARRQLGAARPWPGLSRRLWRHLLAAQGVGEDRRWAELDRACQRRLEEALRADRHTITGRGPFGEEFVTAGGIPLGEVNLATMESRLRPGLHLVGELLDVDGVTGGFNFQHCWSSGWLAGRALARAAALT